MKIRKTVDEKGNEIIEIEIDGEWTENLDSTLSEKLTGTTLESGLGIFRENLRTNFWFGNYCWEIRLPDWKNGTAAQIAEELSSRIEKLQKWVAECKAKAHAEEAEILTTDQVVEKLKDENRLLYRNRAGQIKALDV